jgi:thioredoxin-dependent peroxiredoxin
MENNQIKIGQKAPDFILNDADGVPVSPGDYRGSWLVLYFYPKDNTAGCTVEAIDFTFSAADFKDLNAEIVGISPDSSESHKKFMTKHELGIRLLSDRDQKTLAAYGVWQLKKMYGRESMGVVRSTFIVAPDGRLAHAWTKVSVKGHVDEVLQRLRELVSGRG